ncbi:Integral membrane protein TerC family protein [Phycisphaerae bacterium RAS1]|nr:Integral membrane protein TerC family protein [Phycisphaerae bacterium RAS1]
MDELFTSANLIALLTLSSLEIVLGIDNIVFIAILTGRLDPAVQAKARQIGLLAAMGMRILLLLGIGWVMQWTKPLFTLLGGTSFEHAFSGKDLILVVGGLFLIAKATYEVHHKLEAPAEEHGPKKAAASFSAAILQIMLIDIVFSLDSVITAVGMAQSIAVMIAAVVLAVLVMMVFANPVSNFIEHHPTLKMLALSFLLLIGVMLVFEGCGGHMNKGYIYFAMGFSLFVEMLNITVAKRAKRRAAAT